MAEHILQTKCGLVERDLPMRGHACRSIEAGIDRMGRLTLPQPLLGMSELQVARAIAMAAV
jgi:hypothetical protein